MTPSRARWSRALAFASLAITVALLAACDDDGTQAEEDPAEAIVSMRLTLGASTVMIDEGGNMSAQSCTLFRPERLARYSAASAAATRASGLDILGVRGA